MVSMQSLPPDCLAQLSDCLALPEVVRLRSTSSALRHAVDSNDRLWSRLYQRTYPAAWADGAPPRGWRHAYQETHMACQELRTRPSTRQWSVDTAAITLASLHDVGGERLALTAGGSVLELKRPPPGDQSAQMYGHTGRVTSGTMLDLPGGDRGIISGSADQTVRLWVSRLDVEEADVQPVTLLTPARTLRGHTDGVTSIATITSSSGVTIAATGAKDRSIRLWGLAPLVASPVGKSSGGQVATLRGHGAPITSVLYAKEAGSLLSASQDGRLKAWDVWRAACSGTAKCSMPISAAQLAAGSGALERAVFVGGGRHWQAIDTRSMAAVAGGKQSSTLQCLAQRGETVVTGGSEGACVWDLRRPAQPRLQLRGHDGPVTSCHIDHFKVVTASSAPGEDAARVWHPDSGDCLAIAGGQGDEDHERPGITALAVKGAIVLCGNAEGEVCERDFSAGSLPRDDDDSPGGDLSRKFWQLPGL